MPESDALRRLLSPRSVAVIGGDSAAEVVRQCRKIGYTGELWALNPRREELAGVACVPRVADLPGVPDASFVAAPPEATLAIIRDLAAAGAPGAVCFAAGFAETGALGAGRQRELGEAAGDMAIIGPNCHGYLNYLDGVALWPDQYGGRRCERGVALIAQSGNVAMNLTMQRRGIDFSYVISAGNNSALGMHDYIDALLEDERVTAIGLHVEGLTDIPAFSRSAIRALEKGVPIVAFKAGRSARGAEITMSHTGSLAGSDGLYTALFSRLGIARCDTVSRFLETMKFLSQCGPLPGATIASLSCSGGDATIVADNAERLGVPMPPFADESAKRLKALLGPNVSISNPLDYHLYVWGDLDKLTRCFTEALSNDVACALLVLDYPPGEDNDDASWQVAERALQAAVEATGCRAVIVSSLPETMSDTVRERLKDAGLTPMQGIEDCLFAIRAAADVGAAQGAPGRVMPVTAAQPGSGEAVLLDEWQSKQELAAAGIRVPEGRICNPREVAEAATEIGYPVVLKGLAEGLAHKSEAGAVVVGIETEPALLGAAAGLAGEFECLLIEEMVAPSIAELIVGFSRDSCFGLTMLIGSGGVNVELLQDTVSLLLPVTREEIAAAIGRLRVSALIAGYRDAIAGDLDALIDAADKLAAYAVANADRILELDVNPLIVTPTGAVAADGLIRMTESR
ncbi:acetate--CoA ligase family protein [Lentisalinibacter orientalis]|uniref:acetate--CoA ligase family protein n=1 Tax=Lentisalinibacter orientalis TaxID=2992241 RepID=UPI0038702A78